MKFLRAVVAIIVLVAFDQYTKYMIVEHYPMHQYYPVAGDVFGLYYLQNEGMSWGMFQGKQLIFLIFTILVLILIGFIYVRLLRDVFFRTLNVCLLFLASGAVGNMIDRIFGVDFLHSGNPEDIHFLHGGVVDFLYIKLINFPVFNVADMYVTLSIAVIILLLFTKYRNVELESFLGQNVKRKHMEDRRSSSQDVPLNAEPSEQPDPGNRVDQRTGEHPDTVDASRKTHHLFHIFSNEEEEDD